MRTKTKWSCLKCGSAFVATMWLALAAQGQSLVMEGAQGWLYPGWESVTENNQAGIDQTVSLISEVHNALVKANIKLFVLVVPMKATIYPEYLPKDEELSAAVKNRYAYILRKLADNQIATTDLRPLFLEVKTRHLAFYRTDYHWTPWSAEVVAHNVAPMIDPSVTTKKDQKRLSKAEQWREETRFGDLANLLSRERRKRVGEERFTVRMGETTKGALLEEIKPKVQVIGNSFVQPYLGFSQALGSVLGYPVGLSWNYGSVGPWATLLKYVESDEFKRSHPRVILWQWNEAQFGNGPDAAGQWAKESILPSQVWLNRLRQALNR